MYYQNYLYGDYNKDFITNNSDIQQFINYYSTIIGEKPELTHDDKQKIITEFINGYSTGKAETTGLATVINQRITDYGLNTPPYNREAWRIIYGSGPPEDISQPPSQDDSNTRQQAETILGNVDVAFVNVPKTPGTPADGYDIFFKGPEVLEYQVTFTGDIDDSIKTDENRNIFHNLFTANWITNNPHHVEQAFVIDGSKVYQARRSNADEVNTESTPWSDTDLIHMFSTNTNRKIHSVNKVRYTDAVDEDIVTNAGLIPVLPREQ